MENNCMFDQDQGQISEKLKQFYHVALLLTAPISRIS